MSESWKVCRDYCFLNLMRVLLCQLRKLTFNRKNIHITQSQLLDQMDFTLSEKDAEH